MNFDHLRRYTQARIGLGHSGPALPTKAWLEFSRHHAEAVDAIAISWEIQQQKKEIEALGYAALALNTKVCSREQFLLRPDLGRKLDEPSKKKVQTLKKKQRLVILASNGLSSLAQKNHLSAFLIILLPLLKEQELISERDPILLVPDGRVALIDDIGSILMPDIGITIIGERPGLSAPDSLAVYLTYGPRHGRSDAERNCISNIRPPHGLSYEEAAQKLLYLIKGSLDLKLSGIALKDESALASK